MNNTELIEKCKDLFETETPLKADCGTVCNCACCKGENDIGMILFPGEKTNLEIKDNGAYKLCICKGNCNRKDRPLSCRIFPFFPCINDKGKIKAEIDWRGYSVCPLVSNHKQIRFSRKFIRNVKKCGKILAKDKNARQFLKEQTDIIYEIKSFVKKSSGLV